MKKLLFLLALVVLMLTAVSAQDIKISAEVVQNTVKADVIFSQNPGIAGFSVDMNFDKTKLTPVAIEVGDTLKGYSITSNLHMTDDFSALKHVSAVWISASDTNRNGIFYTVIFDIKDGAKGKTELTLSYNKNDISNSAFESVDFKLTSAVINLDNGTSSSGTTSSGGTDVVIPPSAPQEPEKDPEVFEPKKIYADVAETDWYFADVGYVFEKGLMTGTANEPELLFSPLLYTNRAMFVTVLYRMEGQPKAGKSDFVDVESGSYYEKAVAWAAENGIVNGISPSEFAPLSGITREQTAKIIANYTAYKKLKSPEAKTDITTFNDYAYISDWAREALRLCADMNIIRGRNNNTIDPQGGTTRAETAAILRRLMEYMEA